MFNTTPTRTPPKKEEEGPKPWPMPHERTPLRPTALDLTSPSPTPVRIQATSGIATNSASPPLARSGHQPSSDLLITVDQTLPAGALVSSVSPPSFIPPSASPHLSSSSEISNTSPASPVTLAAFHSKQLESRDHLQLPHSSSSNLPANSHYHVHGSRWRCWERRSPNFRFFILALAMLVPFGGHVIKYSLSSLQKEMLADETFDLNHTQMGMFQSAVSIPNLFMPLVGGLFLDHRGNSKGTVLMLLICLFGHLGFVLACMKKSFYGALFARILFGLGQGSTVVAQGRICATYFVGKEIVFAVALTESAHNLSNFIAFVYVVPVSDWLGGYIWALWMGVGFCILSLIAGLLFYYLSLDMEPDEEQMEIEHTEAEGLISGQVPHAYDTFVDENSVQASPASSVASSDSGLPISRRWFTPCDGLSVGFLILCIIHMTYSNCYHLFAYVSAALISDRFHTSVAKAGWLAGLSNGIAIFLCPVAGLLMDWLGYKMWILVVCGILTTFAYILLFWAAVSPIPSLVMLAVVVSFMPTIMKSSVPNLVVPAVYGVAYGIYEISESLGSVLGNGVVGFFRDTTHSWDMDIEIFAGMAIIATCLTVLLIFLDWMECLGSGSHGHRMGQLNESSFESGKNYDRLKRTKDRFLVKQYKKRRAEELSEEEKRMASENRPNLTGTGVRIEPYQRA